MESSFYDNNINDILEDIMVMPYNRNTVEYIKARCYNFLNRALYNSSYLNYVDILIESKDSGDTIFINGGNLLTCLWLVGIYPSFPPEVSKSGNYVEDGIKYTYNKKLKNLNKIKLKWKQGR